MSPDAVPPGGISGPPGWLLRVVRDQRVAFLIVGGINTVVRVRGHVLVTSVMSRLGHKKYSFRRSPSSGGLHR